MVRDDFEFEVRLRKRAKRKTIKLLFIMAITMVVLIVTSYAWFIGLSVAKVNTFEVKIYSTEGLTISLDGENFSESITLGNTENEILENVLNSFPESTASWLGVDRNDWINTQETEEALAAKKTTELTPISTIGDMDREASVLKIYSKTAMQGSTGGYGLTADIVENSRSIGTEKVPAEQDGYIAFDIFIKNKTNTVYNSKFDSNSDEAIYLSDESAVSLITSSEYTGTEDMGGDGLENSLRVAFMQIGRVSSSASKADVTSITCTTNNTVTGLCNAYTEVSDQEQPDGTHNVTKNDAIGSNKVTFAIWEPNDKGHTDDSKNRFLRICKKRTSKNEYSSTQCEFNASNYMDTYAVMKNIEYSDKVDIFDGLNGYTGNNSPEQAADQRLLKMSYYTDTENASGDAKGQLFSLAPNSITRVRIYIFLEGQDIDNFDISSIGKAFSIEFGFTKNRYEDPEAED